MNQRDKILFDALQQQIEIKNREISILKEEQDRIFIKEKKQS